METATTRCVACREPIQPDASLCSACGTRQKAERLKPIATVLKWLGGITAVVSMFLTMLSLNDIVQEWRDKSTTVDILAEAAAMQMTAGDYPRAWELLDEALAINTGSPQVRSQRIELAMAWLRNIRATENRTFTDMVNQMLPALYLGLVEGNDIDNADVHAHIGWAYYLLSRDGRMESDPYTFYRQALVLDPKNVYANAFRGHNLLTGERYFNDPEAILAEAGLHFDTALSSGREYEFARSYQLSALWNRSGERAASIDYLVVLNSMRINGEPVTTEEWEEAGNVLVSPIGNILRQTENGEGINGMVSPDNPDAGFLDRLLARIPLDELAASWQLMRDDNNAVSLYISGEMARRQGINQAAREAYESALQLANRGYNYIEDDIRAQLDSL